MKIYLLTGVPSSGKTWVCNQLKNLYTVIAHDDYIGKDYVGSISLATKLNIDNKPILAETPFSMSKIMDPLEKKGIQVIPIVIIEDESVLEDRYYARDGVQIPKGHFTRQHTYYSRAKANGWFVGTSEEVLKHLKGLV